MTAETAKEAGWIDELTYKSDFRRKQLDDDDEPKIGLGLACGLLGVITVLIAVRENARVRPIV